MNTTKQELNNIGDVEAAIRLNLSYGDFIHYLHRGLVSYTMVGLERFYTIKELDRFRNEVLSCRGDN